MATKPAMPHATKRFHKEWIEARKKKQDVSSTSYNQDLFLHPKKRGCIESIYINFISNGI